jgi:hypothetical protein
MGERGEAQEGQVSSSTRGMEIDLGKVGGECSEEGGDPSFSSGGKGSLRGIKISTQEESTTLICDKISVRTETPGCKMKRDQKHLSKKTKVKLEQGCKTQQGQRHQAGMKI